MSTINITDEQRQIVHAPLDSSLRISAGPGSGKTTTIIYRIKNMIENHGVPPERIALFTYSRALGEDMRRKLRKEGIPGESIGHCGTLHAYCYKETDSEHDLGAWIELYEDRDEVAPELGWIIFDEYQDADVQIADTIRLLSRGKHLTIIGDERQQIYRFKGADSSLLRKERDDFVDMSLTTSFRCSQEISLLLSALYKSYPPIRSLTTGPKPILYRSKGGHMNRQKIIDKVVAIAKESTGTVAVISPTINRGASQRLLRDIHTNLLVAGLRFDYLKDNENDLYTRKILNVVSSIHGVKGQEFDTVILLNAIDAPFFFEFSTDENSDELCKLFVAFSRARTGLHVFEHRYNENRVGSLRWISDNEELFDLHPDWIEKPVFMEKHSKGVDNRETTCLEFVQLLPHEERRGMLERYSAPELISQEQGVGDHCGSPEISGLLVEKLLASKLLYSLDLFDTPKVILTEAEWNSIIGKKVYVSFYRNLYIIYPGSTLHVNYFPNSIDIRRDGRLITTLDKENIASNLMCSLYYKHLPDHLKNIRELKRLKSLERLLEKENVQRLYDALNFKKLSEYDYSGFKNNRPTCDDIEKVITYVKNTMLLSNRDVKGYHLSISRSVKSQGEERKVRGELDFETDDSVIEVKCHREEKISDVDWLQAIMYNELLSNAKKEVLVYNAIHGQLWSRKMLQPT